MRIVSETNQPVEACCTMVYRGYRISLSTIFAAVGGPTIAVFDDETDADMSHLFDNLRCSAEGVRDIMTSIDRAEG